MKNRIIILLLFICSSCNQTIFEKQLSVILGIHNVEIEKSQRIDVSGGLRKSYLMEIYELSPSSITSFLQSKKELPINDEYGPWCKYGWFNTSLMSDSLYSQFAPIILESDWGNKDIEVKLINIRKAIEDRNIYWGFYCKPNMEEMEYVQMYILDTLSNNLYIIDSNM